MDIKASVDRQTDAGYGVVRKMQSQEAFAGMVTRMRAMPQVVIAAVNGPAAGAGFGLALAAEMRIAAKSAKFLVASVRIGLTSGECGISYHLPRLIGAARAFEVMLTGRPIDADEAERIGLVSRVVADDELMPSALQLAGGVLANSPFSIRQSKQMIWTNLEAPSLDAALEVENRAQILATFTDDFREATRAFAEKRAPKFTGS
jgi:enoyl-CoA hydratase